MRTHFIIIIFVTIISLGIGLYLILTKSCPSQSSNGVNSRSIGQRAQFTNIEEFTKKNIKEYYKSQPKECEKLRDTTNYQCIDKGQYIRLKKLEDDIPKKIKLGIVFNKFKKTIKVYKDAGILTENQVKIIENELDPLRSIKVTEDSEYQGDMPFFNIIKTLINSTDKKKQNVAIGILGDMLNIQQSGNGMTINWISSNENGYTLRVPQLACSEDNSLYSFINPSAENRGSIVDHLDTLPYNNDTENLHQAREFVNDRAFVYKDIAVKNSKDMDDYDGVCKSNTYSGNRPETYQQPTPTTQPRAPENRIRKFGDSCERMRQNMWGNTWGSLLLMIGGVNEVTNCDPSIADPTNFVNNTSTSDWSRRR